MNSNQPNNMTTEITPEKCPFCGSAKRNALPAPNGAIRYGCGYWSDAYDEQSDLCRALERANKAEAEVAEIKRDYHQPELCNERIMGVVDENTKLRELLDRLFTDGISCLEIHQIRAEYNQLTKQ